MWGKSTMAMNNRPKHTLLAGIVVTILINLASIRPVAAQGIGLKQLLEELDWGTGSLVLFDKVEFAPGAEGRPVAVDAIGWYGGDYDRLWFRAEGEQLTSAPAGEGEMHAYYGRLITPFWDALGGVRIDSRWGDGSGLRPHLALGLIGMAPLRFELSPAVFLSSGGALSARLEAEYQLLVTQRLYAEPELELNAALQEVPEWEVGSGLNDVELGLRLRYEIWREFSPYVGVTWIRRVGGTADLLSEAGEEASEVYASFGVRMWY